LIIGRGARSQKGPLTIARSAKDVSARREAGTSIVPKTVSGVVFFWLLASGFYPRL